MLYDLNKEFIKLVFEKVHAEEHLKNFDNNK